MYQAAPNSMFEPNELAFLQRIFNDMCLERGLSDKSAAANNLAAEMIQLYQRGVKDEQGLHSHFERNNVFG
jgi:hypothetical protein